MLTWARKLLDWYAQARREMPWRGHPDAYAVWVSEIMLQQTQVDTVRPYFTRFLQAFPDIAALASASDEALLKSWEGLGYYTRVRNLRKAAQCLVAQYNSELPHTAEALEKLPGIGAYTAAAIASICFNEAIPVVDGNVARVFARFNLLSDDFSKDGNRRKLAAWLTPIIQTAPIPGDFNQAMMELGALVCTPRNPKCDECPLRDACQAKRKQMQDSFPHKSPTKTLPERTCKVVALQNEMGEWLFAKHEGERLLAGFWEFPKVTALPFPLAKPKKSITHRQTFSHFRQITTVYTATLPEAIPPLPETLRWSATPEALPLTTATRKILSKLRNR